MSVDKFLMLLGIAIIFLSVVEGSGSGFLSGVGLVAVGAAFGVMMERERSGVTKRHG